MNSKNEDQLLLAKHHLMVALGDSKTTYLTNMKLWFRQKWTKEEFDRESRKLLGIEHIHLHNQFFLALLNKIQPLQQPPSSNGPAAVFAVPNPPNTTVSKSHSSKEAPGTARVQNTDISKGPAAKRPKRTSRPNADRVAFDAAGVYKYLFEENPENFRPADGNSPPRSISPQRFSAQELFLPDASLVMGRLLVGAWESGLVSAEENVADMIVLAVQNLLKNIITAVLTKRKHCRVTAGGKFIYDVGVEIPDPSLRATVQYNRIDDGPIEIDKNITSMSVMRPDKRDDGLFVSRCEDLDDRPKRRINVLDLYKALADRQVIPSHSVYANNMERITQMLH